MEYNKNFTKNLAILLSISFIIVIGAVIGMWFLADTVFPNDNTLKISLWLVLTVVCVGLATFLLTKIIFKPLKTLSDAIVYAGHSNRGGNSPDTTKLKLGREMITALALQVYDLASMSSSSAKLSNENQPVSSTEKQDSSEIIAEQKVIENPNAMIDRLALPIFGIDPDQIVTTVNKAACEYIGKKSEEIIGKPFYDAAPLSFQGDETFEQWLKSVQQKTVNSTRSWERTRITDPKGNALKQFDLVASFSKASQSGTETMLALYDRTEQYALDDGEVSFVALAVHELRTPLTLMRGYIEVFQDDLGPTLSPELAGFMHKMQASAQQLTSFVGNILNVARIQENQLVLKLEKHDWSEIVMTAVEDLELRARVHGKHIEVKIADNIPPVAVDRISIHEVINNLVDNAIKYSGQSDKIIITSTVNSDGLIETSIQDFGIGIPDSVVPDLFQKFYRSHKSKEKIIGSGLGLYLCKSVIGAHGGNIWVHTKEGQGSIFSFTIQDYEQVKTEDNGQDGIMRGAHGWIKNHSMNRQ